jgi:hypothetical protein
LRCRAKPLDIGMKLMHINTYDYAYLLDGRH